MPADLAAVQAAINQVRQFLTVNDRQEFYSSMADAIELEIASQVVSGGTLVNFTVNGQSFSHGIDVAQRLAEWFRAQASRIRGRIVTQNLEFQA
jgi:hypothetical protein